MVPIAHSKDTWDVCVYTDASQDHWGSQVTQLAPGKYLKQGTSKSLPFSIHQWFLLRFHATMGYYRKRSICYCGNVQKIEVSPAEIKRILHIHGPPKFTVHF